MKKLDLIFLLISICGLPYILLYHRNFVTWVSNNGILDFIGLVLTVAGLYIAWRTFIQPLLQERDNNKKTQKLLEQTLLKEFWNNMKFIEDIKTNYEKNLENLSTKNIYISPYGPRKTSLKMIITPNFLDTWKKNPQDQQTLLEVLEQTEMFIEKYKDWKQKILFHPEFIQDKNLYQSYFEPMTQLGDSLMKNMLELWRPLLTKSDIVKDLKNNQIKQIGEEVSQLIQEGKWITGAYKSSFFKNEGIPGQDYDVIICWEDDWHNRPKEITEIIELKTYLE